MMKPLFFLSSWDIKIEQNIDDLLTNPLSFISQEVPARTCLETTSFPKGIGAPFSVAILFKVARAFSWFPDNTSYLALSGSH